MKKILIVDDIDTNRKLLKQTLAALNTFEIFEAADGKEAISIFEDNAPDLILMDINMPGMDGCQATTAIKKSAGDIYTPVIFVTALSVESSLATALESGGDDFISKPFDFDILNSKINAHLRIRELNQQLNDKNLMLVNHNRHLQREQELIEHFFESALQKSYLDNKYIKYHMSSLSAFNGDLLLVERAPDGGLYLIMGDFTGHGLTAAMGTLPVAMIFFTMASKGVTVGDIARELNRQLNKLMPPGIFLAATILELNMQGNCLTAWVGGMPECYILDKNGAFKSEIHAQHMPLGILADHEFEMTVERVEVSQDDKVYMYSDGVIESKNIAGEMFGEVRLKDIILNKDHVFSSILSELRHFTDYSEQDDDITLVELTCLPIPAKKRSAQAEQQATTIPWQFTTTFTEDEIRDFNIVSKLSETLGALPELRRHKDILQILLSEMYFNAIDHSILGLGSSDKTDDEGFQKYYQERELKLQKLNDAFVKFDFHIKYDNNQQYLKIVMKDSGQGYSGHISNQGDEKLYGRGLTIINSFCENLQFSENGKQMEVLYPLS